MEERTNINAVDDNNMEEFLLDEEDAAVTTEEETSEDTEVSDADVDNISDILTSDEDDDMLTPDNVMSADLVGDYLKSIGTYKLLEKEEEIDLSNLVQAGLKAKEQLEIIDTPEITDDNREEITKTLLKLQETMHKGEEARQKLINHNLKLVVSIAKKYRGCKCDMLDLIQEGNIGLMTATEKFDPTKGYRFSTYATWWIKQGITRYIMNTSNTIRIPVHAMETILKINRAIKELTVELGREPHSEEIAAKLNMEVARVDELRIMSSDMVSLDSTVNNADGDGDTTVGDFVADHMSLSPEDEVCSSDLHNELMQILNNGDFTAKEQDIICKRMGLNGNEKMTLEQIGEIYNVTRERIRQIEAKAMRKLRHPKNKKRLKNYLS